MMDAHFRKRIKRQLYYGDKADLDKPSLPLTELTVEYFKDSVSQNKLGHVDLDVASNLVKRNNVSPCSMVLSMLYAKRLRQRNSEYLSSISSTDVFFISMMMASKYIYDEGVDEEVFNDEWAVNSKQEVDDVNTMEIDFLQAMDWGLFVRPEEFETVLVDVEKRLALREGLGRGWFTYAELAVLADMNLISNLWNNVGLDCSKVSAVLSAAYVAGILSMIGSAAIAAQVSGPLSSAVIATLSTQLSPTLVNPCALPPCHLTGFESGAGDWQGGHFDIQDPQENETDCSLADGLCVDSVGYTGGLVEDSHPLATATSPTNPVTGCENDEGCKDEPPPTPKATSSLLSILFLDSLLSQLVSVSAGKSKVEHQNGSGHHCMNNKINHGNKSYTQRKQRKWSTTRSAHNSKLPSAFPDQRLHNFESSGLPSESCSNQNWLSHCQSICQWKQNVCTSAFKDSCTARISSPHFLSLSCGQGEQLLNYCLKCLTSYSDLNVLENMNHILGPVSFYSSPWKSDTLNDPLQTSLVTDAGLMRETFGYIGSLSRAIEVT